MDCKCSSVAFTGSTRDSSSSADAVSLRRRRRDHESTVATSMSCSGRGIVALTSKLWCLSSQLFLLHSTTTLVEVSAQRDDAAAFRPTAGWTQGRSPYLGREASVHPTWLRTEKGDALAEQSSHHNSHMWPRFIGIGDGDFEAEAGWVTVDQQASVAKCGVTSTNLGEQQTEQ
ncbi:unnamed protein product [Amoebophrya sp. A25]|nr:unnamed protein product [Amoebophrya sp. A25]|eukprot:GSA25T00026738001.1